MNNSDFPDADSRMYYWFLASYEAMLQGKGMGGLLAFTGEGEYIAGYRMAGTAEDFFKKIPASTLCVPCPMPTSVARGMFAALGDMESVSSLTSWIDKTDAVMLISVLKLYDGIVLEESAYSIAKSAIDDRCNASGMDPRNIYAAYEASGVSMDELVLSVLDGETSAADAVLEGIRLIKASNKAEEEKRDVLVSRILIVAGFTLLLLAIIILVSFLIMKNKYRNILENGKNGYNDNEKG